MVADYGVLLQAKEEVDQLDQLQTDRASLAFGSALVGHALAVLGIFSSRHILMLLTYFWHASATKLSESDASVQSGLQVHAEIPHIELLRF